jgi:hypothetical protein
VLRSVSFLSFQLVQIAFFLVGIQDTMGEGKFSIFVLVSNVVNFLDVS